VAINPAGTQIASAWGDGRIAIWKIDVPAARALAGDNGAAATLAVVSPNNQLLATDGVVDGKPAIILHDIASGNVVRSIVGHEGPIAALAFSPDSARLASGSADKTARVWNVADGAQVASFAGHTNTVTGVAFNSNGQQVVSGAADNTLKLWNTADATELKNLAGHTAPITGVAMAANDQFIVSSAGDNTVRVWNPADGAQLRAMDVAAPATALALSRDLARVAVAGADNAVKVFQVADGALLFTLAGHGAPARSLAFSPDNTRLVTAGPDNQALVWELTAGKLIEVVPVAAGLTAAAYGPDANTLLVASADKSILAQSVHFERSLEGNAMPISGLAYSNDGGVVYTACQDGTVRGYGAADGGQRFAANHGAVVHDLALSADGQWLASAGEDKFVRIWNAGNGGGGPMPQLGPFQAAARSVCFTRDNLRVVGGSAGNEVTVFDLQTGQPAQANAEHAAAVASLAAVGETVPTIVSASADGTVLMWPILAVRQMTGHAGPVTSLAAIPTVPTQIISGSEDGTIRQWNLDNGSEMRQFGHGGPITSVAVRPDGKRFASASSNNIAKLWNAENGQPVAELRGDLRLQGLLAVANKELQKGTALVATRKAALDAAQKDIPVKTEAATKAAEALAAAVKASEEKAAAKKVADDAKAAADKASVDAAAAFKVAEEAFNTAKAAADGDANNADLAKAKTDAEAALAVAKQTADDAAAAATAAVKPVEEATAALTAADQVKQTAQKASDEAALLQKKAEELVPTSTTAVTEAEEAVKVLEAGVQQATATANAGEMPIRAVAFAPDNIQLATGGDDMTVHTWNSETGAPLETYKGHAGIVRSLAFADNTKLVSGAADNSAALWDLVPNWTLERTIGGIDSADFIDRVISLGFSPDGGLLATGGGEPSRSGELKIWNVADGTLVRELVDAHSDTVFGVDFSANGKLLASCAADKFVKVFDVTTGERVRSFEGHTHHVLGVTWKDDATRLVSCGADNAIKVWNFETGDQIATIAGYAKQVTSISFMGDTPNTVSSGGDATVRFHNTDNNQNYRNFSGAVDFVYSAAATPDGKLVIAGGQDSVLRLWNGESGALLQSFAPPPADDPAASAQAAK
jgi:WD40 repeat protein